MSCRTRTEQQPVSAASVIPLLWFTLYKYPNKQVCFQEYSGERQNTEKKSLNSLSEWRNLFLTIWLSNVPWLVPQNSLCLRQVPTPCTWHSAQSHQEYAQHFLGTSQGNAYFSTVLCFWILTQENIIKCCSKILFGFADPSVSGCRWSSNQDFDTITRVYPLSDTSAASSIPWWSLFF